jgi:hypothetical protein
VGEGDKRAEEGRMKGGRMRDERETEDERCKKVLTLKTLATSVSWRPISFGLDCRCPLSANLGHIRTLMQ